MTKSQKDNSLQISSFLKQLSSEMLPGKKNQTLIEKSKDIPFSKETLKKAARAKAIRIAKEKVEEKKKALKQKQKAHHEKVVEEQKKHKKSLHINAEENEQPEKESEEQSEDAKAEAKAKAKKAHIDEMMKDEDSKPAPSTNNSSEEKDKPPRDEKSTPEKGPHSFNDDKPAVHQISDEKKAEIEQERQQSQALILEKQK